MKSKLVIIVTYLRFIYCAPVAAKYIEKVQDIPPEQQEQTYAGLPYINKLYHTSTVDN